MKRPAANTPTSSPQGWQVIACDLDGTLLGRDLKANTRDLEALCRAREAGLHVAICTGRNALECAPVIEPLALRGPGVFVNGAVIADMATRCSLERVTIAWPLVAELIDFFSDLGHAVLLLADDDQTGLPLYLRTQRGTPHRATVEWMVAHRMSAVVQADIEERLRPRIVRAGIVVDVPEALAIEQGLTSQFNGRIVSYSVFSPVYHCQVIDVFNPQATKWTGIEALCRHLGVPATNAVAIGDDLNDLPMLRQARLSFAMGNTSAVVRQAAKRVTLPQAESGVAHVLDGILAGDW